MKTQPRDTTDHRDQEREQFLGKGGAQKLDTRVRNAVEGGKFQVKKNGQVKTVLVKD